MSGMHRNRSAQQHHVSCEGRRVVNIVAQFSVCIRRSGLAGVTSCMLGL